jgi:hypothetical protein
MLTTSVQCLDLRDKIIDPSGLLAVHLDLAMRGVDVFPALETFIRTSDREILDLVMKAAGLASQCMVGLV